MLSVNGGGHPFLTAPPLSPVEGNLWVVGAAATDAWAGYDNYLAQFIGGSWNFYPGFDGLVVWLKDESITARFVAGIWQKGVL